VAIVSTGFLAVAATAGIALSQADGPQTANASPTIAVANHGPADRSAVSQTEAHTKLQTTPKAPTQATTPKAAAPAATPKAPAPAATPKAPTQATTPAAPASRVLDFQFQPQPNYYYCGPAATRIALTASGHTLSQDEIAEKLHTTTSGTDSAIDTTRGLNEILGGNVYQTRDVPGPSATPAQMDQLQADVVRAISGGRAVVANVDHGVTDTDGNSHTYDGGHFLTIVGYKDSGRTVKIADPAIPNGGNTYWVTTINMTNWMTTHGYSY
jgi:hypothetical protein